MPAGVGEWLIVGKIPHIWYQKCCEVLAGWLGWSVVLMYQGSRFNPQSRHGKQPMSTWTGGATGYRSMFLPPSLSPSPSLSLSRGAILCHAFLSLRCCQQPSALLGLPRRHITPVSPLVTCHSPPVSVSTSPLFL